MRKPDKSLAVLKTLNGGEYQLNQEQVKEREKVNEQLRAKYNDKLVKHYTIRSQQRQGLKRLKILNSALPFGKPKRTIVRYKKQYKQELIDAYVEKKIKQFLNKRSAPIIFQVDLRTNSPK
jgi:hypothetical protein